MFQYKKVITNNAERAFFTIILRIARMDHPIVTANNFLKLKRLKKIKIETKLQIVSGMEQTLIKWSTAVSQGHP